MNRKTANLVFTEITGILRRPTKRWVTQNEYRCHLASYAFPFFVVTRRNREKLVKLNEPYGQNQKHWSSDSGWNQHTDRQQLDEEEVLDWSWTWRNGYTTHSPSSPQEWPLSLWPSAAASPALAELHWNTHNVQKLKHTKGTSLQHISLE